MDLARDVGKALGREQVARREMAPVATSNACPAVKLSQYAPQPSPSRRSDSTRASLRSTA